MRRTPTLTITTLLVALLTGLAATVAGVPAAAEQPTHPPVTLPEQAAARAVLVTAERVLDGQGAPGDPEPTMALLELRHTLEDLSGTDRVRAKALLDSPGTEPQGTDQKVAPNRAKKCSSVLCVHYITSPTSGHRTSEAWAEETFRTLQRVWAVEVDRMGYRAPLRDGGHRGDGRLDIELQNLAQGVYGFCSPHTASKRTSGSCVLDNDYDDFPDPLEALRATAAHEFFHVVQYAYDSYEDPWFMESSATWMEERVYDGVDDNRQYLRVGQLHRSAAPLDSFNSSGAHYGNWIYLEHLSHRFGNGIVKRAWGLAGRKSYSLPALRAVLRNHGGFVRDYARFAGANTHPASAYPEGGAYPRPRPARGLRMGPGQRRVDGAVRIDHLASKTWRVKPDTRNGRRWRLRIRVDGPSRAASPQLAVTVLRTGGGVERRLVRLDSEGRGATTVPLHARGVRDVSVTPVNASTRYRCNRGTSFACEGVSVHDRRRFELRLRAFRR